MNEDDGNARTTKVKATRAVHALYALLWLASAILDVVVQPLPVPVPPAMDDDDMGEGTGGEGDGGGGTGDGGGRGEAQGEAEGEAAGEGNAEGEAEGGARERGVLVVDELGYFVLELAATLGMQQSIVLAVLGHDTTAAAKALGWLLVPHRRAGEHDLTIGQVHLNVAATLAIGRDALTSVHDRDGIVLPPLPPITALTPEGGTAIVETDAMCGAGQGKPDRRRPYALRVLLASGQGRVNRTAGHVIPGVARSAQSISKAYIGTLIHAMEDGSASVGVAPCELDDAPWRLLGAHPPPTASTVTDEVFALILQYFGEDPCSGKTSVVAISTQGIVAAPSCPRKPPPASAPLPTVGLVRPTQFVSSVAVIGRLVRSHSLQASARPICPSALQSPPLTSHMCRHPPPPTRRCRPVRRS